jgi:hypothetical protein
MTTDVSHSEHPEQFTQVEANLAYRRLELKNTIIRHDRIGFIYRL